MKRILLVAIAFLVLIPALVAMSADDVVYVNGTASNVSANTAGKFDLTRPDSLTFEHSGKTFAIPYSSIESFDYSRPVTRHLGVLPAIAVGLLKQRQHRHIIRIAYKDNSSSQVAIFEVSKQMPATLLAVLTSRVPKACNRAMNCGQWQ